MRENRQDKFYPFAGETLGKCSLRCAVVLMEFGSFFCAKDIENLPQKHAKTHHVVSKNAKPKTQEYSCVFG